MIRKAATGLLQLLDMFDMANPSDIGAGIRLRKMVNVKNIGDGLNATIINVRIALNYGNRLNEARIRSNVKNLSGEQHTLLHTLHGAEQTVSQMLHV